MMAHLTVRSVDEAIVEALQERAAKAGRSMEAEHRKILEEVLRPGQQQDFFSEARARRVKLDSGAATTEMLRKLRYQESR